MTSPRPESLTDASECRRRAEAALDTNADQAPLRAAAWAVLAVAAELTAIRRQLAKGGR